VFSIPSVEATMTQSIVDHVPFGLVGEFLGFIRSKKHQPRAVKLRWLNQEIVIKLAKYLRDDQTVNTLIPGTSVQIWGIQKPSRERSHLKLKAHRISKSDMTHSIDHQMMMKLVDEQPIKHLDVVEAIPIAKSKPATLKICTESGCMKRGGKSICKFLESSLGEDTWGQEIVVKATGCMGKCKSGPHLIVMPDRVSYSKIQPKEVAGILTKHFKTKTLR
jgi:(2Fe-2S) ferredoxin